MSERRKAKILVIDDNQGDFELLSVASKEIQFDAHYAQVTHAKAAFDHLELGHAANADRPDLILLDINLPGIAGPSVLDRLKQDERFSSIPVVMYSSSLRVEDQTETAARGAAGFMVKPATFEGYFPLLTTLSDLIEYYRLTNDPPSI